MDISRNNDEKLYVALKRWWEEVQRVLSYVSETVHPVERASLTYVAKLAEVQDLIDNSLCKAVNELAEARAELGREHNLRLSINKLPVELLCIIFQHATVQSGEKYKVNAIKLLALGVAAVCSHWRTIALGCPPLWNTVDFARLKPGQAKLYLQRSRGLPLTLLRCNVFTKETTAEMLASNLSNVMVVSIARPAGSRDPQLITSAITLLTTAPTAQPLMLNSFTCDFNTGDYDHLAIFNAPLFGGQTPSLRHVKFVGTRMPWNRGFYRDLHSIEINYCLTGKQSTKDIDICHVFRDCPRLHTLNLALTKAQWAIDVIQDDGTLIMPHASLDRVLLKFLRRLKLRIPVEYVHHILSSFIADSLREVDIHFDTCGKEESDMACSVPLLLPPSVFSPLHSLQILRRECNDDILTSEINGYDSTSGPLQTNTPKFRFTAWHSRRTREGNVVDYDIGEAIAQAMKPHLQPLVSLSYSLDGAPQLALGDISRLLDMFMPDSPNLRPTADPEDLQSRPQPSNITEPSEHRVPSRLKRLELEMFDLGLDATYEVVEWCKGHGLLEELALVDVTVCVPTEDDLERFSATLHLVGFTSSLKRCWCRFADGREERIRWDTP